MRNARKFDFSWMRKALALALVLTLVFGNVPPLNLLAKATEVTEISDAAGLKAISQDPSGSYKLTADITLSGNWTPIADFRGTFDGNGHTISCLSITGEISGEWNNNYGLFGRLRGGATIKNLTLKDVNIAVSRSDNYDLNVGGIAGCVLPNGSNPGDVVIDNCAVVGGSISITTNATAWKHSSVGGIVGLSMSCTEDHKVTITNCYNSANLTVDAQGTGGPLWLGGIAGGLETNKAGAYYTLVNNAAVGKVTAKGAPNGAYIGGIAGRARNTSTATTNTVLNNCYSNADIDTTGLTITSNIHTSDIVPNRKTDTSANLYGLWGSGTNVTKKTAAEMKSEDFVTTLNNNRNALAATIDGLLYWQAVEGGYPVLTAEKPIEKWTEFSAGKFNGGSGTENAPYEIATAEQLAYLATLQNPSGYYKLTANIDLSQYQWTPISGFAGHFDGCNYAITGLNIKKTYAVEVSAGLFGTVYGGASIKNLVLENVNIQVTHSTAGSASVAGIVGKLLINASYPGGVVIDNCRVKNGSINLTTSATTTWGNYAVGGILGYANVSYDSAGQSVIRNCVNGANLSVTTTHTSLTPNTSTGEGAISLYIGGVAGCMETNKAAVAVSIVNCGNFGTVTASGTTYQARVGGLAGRFRNSDSGAQAMAQMTNCYNAGEVTASGVTYTSACCVGSAVGHGTGACTVGNTYGLQTTAISYGNADVNETKTADEMKQPGFVDTLNTYANADAGLMEWVAVSDGYPTLYQPDGKASLTVNATGGKVTVTANDTVQTGNIRLKIGTQVTLTLTADTGRVFQGLTVGGQTVTLTEGEYSFTLQKDTDVCATFGWAEGVSYYVSPNATAEGDGTQGAPYTLQKALEKIAQLRAEGSTTNITVYLLDGTYRLAETLNLTAAHSSDTAGVTFQNAQGAKPVITSGVDISNGWTDTDGDGIYEYRFNGTAPQFRDLYVDGQRATLARTKSYVFKCDYDNVELEAEGSSEWNTADNSLYISPEALAGIGDGDVSALKIELCQSIEWKHQIFHLASVNQLKTQDGEVNISLDATEWEKFVAGDKTKKCLVLSYKTYNYWLQNHLSFLDEPGEFYYDQTKGTVYYKPYSNQSMNHTTVEYSTLDILVKLDHASNMTFDGITFTGTTANWITDNGMPGQLGASQYGYGEGTNNWTDCGDPMPCAAIFGDYATGVVIKNCVFEELGGSGVIMQYGIENLTVEGNRMKNLGISGIQVGVPQVLWNQGNKPGHSVDVVIENNYVTNIGLIAENAPAIAVKRAENLRINYNTIVHVPYSGITAGWGFDCEVYSEGSEATFFKNLVNAEIAYNDIEDFVYSANDGAAIYTNGANAQPTVAIDESDSATYNRIHHNYIRAGAHDGTYTGIYHDGSASNWITEDNVIDDLKYTNEQALNRGPIYFQDSVESQRSHNLIVRKNITTVSEIVYTDNACSKGYARNVVLKENRCLTHRGLLMNDATALAIMNGAGLQEAYKHLESPMDTELRVDDNSKHFVVTKGTFSSNATAMMRLKLTNNTGSDRSYTVTANGLPDGMTMGTVNNITVRAGQTVLVEVLLTFTKKVERTVVGLVVQDDTGRKTSYPRAFTVKAESKVLESSTTVSQFELSGANILPGETLTMKFFVDKTKLSGDLAANPYYALISRPNENGKMTVVEKVYSENWNETTNYYSISTDLVARQMTDTLQVQIFDAATNEPVSKVWTDSIKAYALRIVDDSAQDEAAKPALIDMLYYGAAAQEKLGYAVEYLATAGLTEKQKEYATPNVDIQFEDKRQIEGADHYLGSSIIVGNDLLLKLYFKNITDKTGYRVEITFTNHRGEEKRITVQAADFWQGNATTYAVTVNGLVVADVSTLVTCTLYDGDDQVVSQVTDSVGSYLARQYEATNEQTYMDVMKFCTSTYAYVHRNDLTQ